MSAIESKNMSNYPTFTVPLSAQAHTDARRFAAEQSSVEKGKQVYLNTLAVYAARQIIDDLGFEATLAQGDCWNPARRLLGNLADLEVAELGKLECRPILPGQTELVIPSEATEDRLAYLAIQLEPSLQTASLTGFIRAAEVQSTQIPLVEITSANNLLDYLCFLETGKQFLESEDPDAQATKQLLQSRGLPEVLVIASLESLFHQSPNAIDDPETPYQVADELAGFTSVSLIGQRREADRQLAMSRGEASADMAIPDSQTTDLAGRFFKKLVNHWQTDSL
jgi:hypothetical protein